MRKALPFLFALTGMSCALAAQTLSPPVAKKIHTQRTVNGVVLVDDYAWLRERSSPEVHQYLEAENAYAEAATASERPLAEKLYNETLGHIQQTDESVPYRKNGYIYYSRTEQGKQYAVFCRKKGSLAAPEEVMLDGNEMAKGEKFFSLGGMSVSDDNHLIAYSVDTVGFRQYHLHVKDLSTGKVLPDTAERVTSFEWAADNKTLFYATEDATTKRSDLVHASLPLTVPEYEEWGNPNEKKAFDYMLTYSPYDNVQAKAYPAILVQTSFDDSQVMYWEPSKYTAKLRAMKTDSNPLVFFVNMHGGHGGSSGRYDAVREYDRDYAFMLTQLGITQ